MFTDTTQKKFCITIYFLLDIMLNQLIFNRYEDRTKFRFCYFSVTYTLRFLLIPDKKRERTDSCQGSKLFLTD